jgi:hypothetical protein
VLGVGCWHGRILWGLDFCARHTHPIFIRCFCLFIFHSLGSTLVLLKYAPENKVELNRHNLVSKSTGPMKILQYRPLRNVEISHESYKNFIGLNLFSFFLEKGVAKPPALLEG